MRRQFLPPMLGLLITGCMSMDNGSDQLGNPAAGGCTGNYGRSSAPRMMQTMQDGYGQGVPIQGVWAANPPGNKFIEAAMLKNNVDPRGLDIYDENTMMALNSAITQGSPGGFAQPPRPYPKGGFIMPKDMPLYPGLSTGVMQAAFNAGQKPSQPAQPSWGNYANSGYYPNYSGYYPYYGSYPSSYYQQPGTGYPNPQGGGSGVIHADVSSGGSTADGLHQAQYNPASGGAGYGQPGGYAPYSYGSGGGNPYANPYSGGIGGYCAPGGAAANQRTQVKFTRPYGMKVHWYTRGWNGCETYSPTPIETPGEYNFPQGAVYRLKISNIVDHPEVELYPTMEVMVANAKTQDFLAHCGVPVAFTEEDFKQVKDGNYLVKVIYLPDPNYQDVAGSGIGEILSTRLDPGQDPVLEARKRGAVLMVIRIGNVQQELRHTPPLSAGAAYPPSMMGAPGCAPGNPGCPPGMSGPPGYPPTGPMPGPSYGPGGVSGFGSMPGPSLGLGGPGLNTPIPTSMRPLPQRPYMYYPYSPYANPMSVAPGMSNYYPLPAGQYAPAMQYQYPGNWQQCPPGYQYPPQGYSGQPSYNQGYLPGSGPATAQNPLPARSPNTGSFGTNPPRPFSMPDNTASTPSIKAPVTEPGVKRPELPPPFAAEQDPTKTSGTPTSLPDLPKMNNEVKSSPLTNPSPSGKDVFLPPASAIDPNRPSPPPTSTVPTVPGSGNSLFGPIPSSRSTQPGQTIPSTPDSAPKLPPEIPGQGSAEPKLMLPPGQGSLPTPGAAQTVPAASTPVSGQGQGTVQLTLPISPTGQKETVPTPTAATVPPPVSGQGAVSLPPPVSLPGQKEAAPLPLAPTGIAPAPLPVAGSPTDVAPRLPPEDRLPPSEDLNRVVPPPAAPQTGSVAPPAFPAAVSTPTPPAPPAPMP